MKKIKSLIITSFILLTMAGCSDPENTELFSYNNLKFGDSEQKLIEQGYQCSIKENLKRICEKNISENMKGLIEIENNVIKEMLFLGDYENEEKCLNKKYQTKYWLIGMYNTPEERSIGVKGMSHIVNTDSYKGNFKNINSTGESYINYNVSCHKKNDNHYSIFIKFKEKK